VLSRARSSTASLASAGKEEHLLRVSPQIPTPDLQHRPVLSTGGPALARGSSGRRRKNDRLTPPFLCVRVKATVRSTDHGTHNSKSTTMTATITAPPSNSTRLALRRLYFARFVFAIAWAALFAATSSPVESFALVLLVIYPAFDVVAAVIDTRTSSDRKSYGALYLNVAMSAVTAVVMAVVGDDTKGILLVWGAWAITAGAVQLAVGIMRRALGGQLPMMLSGGISILAGTFIATSAQNAESVSMIAGYAVLGGVFFLVSALRLGRPARPVAEAVS